MLELCIVGVYYWQQQGLGCELVGVDLELEIVGDVDASTYMEEEDLHHDSGAVEVVVEANSS